MGYFSNSCEGDAWESENCARCHHNPLSEDALMCPITAAHMLYAYEFCNAKDNPTKIILDMLIPRNRGDIGNGKCAMFVARNGVSDKHLKDWSKYKAAMAEMEASK